MFLTVSLLWGWRRGDKENSTHWMDHTKVGPMSHGKQAKQLLTVHCETLAIQKFMH